MLSYLAYYHTLLWVICKHPSEAHIPILNRLWFLLLSLGFNLFVVVIFTATDYSLININCPSHEVSPSHEACPPWAKTGWQAAQIGLVALIDTAFWPFLKAYFFYVHDARHNPTCRTVLRGISACVFGILFFMALRMAWNHEQEMSSVLPEFLTTWPTARVTECFKLMSLWGFLMEYAMVDTTPPDDGRYRGPSGSGYPDGSPPPDDDPLDADTKRVPLLAAQHAV